jgi:hypothetical protein
MRALGGVTLLILDDWGPEPLSVEQPEDLLEIVEVRYGRGATLITSQIPGDRRQRRTWLLTANLISLRVEAVHQVGQRADQVFAESVAEASVNPDPQATP